MLVACKVSEYVASFLQMLIVHQIFDSIPFCRILTIAEGDYYQEKDSIHFGIGSIGRICHLNSKPFKLRIVMIRARYGFSL